MKRILISLLLCFALLSASLGTAAAQVTGSESSDDLFSLLITVIKVGGAVTDALSSDPGDTSDPTAEVIPTEKPIEFPTALPTVALPTAALPTRAPEAVPTATAIPTAIPTAVPTAVPTEVPSGPETSAPADPESIADSTGIEVSDFYDTFKTNVKNGGRHSVSLEEKARKGAAKVAVDDNISLYLYNTKSVITSFSYEATYSGSKEAEGIAVIFGDLLTTIDKYLGIRFKEGDAAKIYETVSQGGSTVYGNLLFYGTPGQSKLTVKIYYTGESYVEPYTTSYSQNAENEFRELISDLKADGIIPNSNGSYHFHENYQTEWAQINWYQWESFDTAQNFVISADLEWKSASDTPNYGNAGCGFVFRSADTSNNLYASVNMDGKVHMGGFRYGNSISYRSFSYGTHSTRGTAQFVLAVNGDQATVYVDGSRIGTQHGLAITDSGYLAFNVLSGTNKDYGTRCIFSNVYYYTW